MRGIAITTPYLLGDIDDKHLYTEEATIVDTPIVISSGSPEKSTFTLKTTKGKKFVIEGIFNDLSKLGLIQKIKDRSGLDGYRVNPKVLNRKLLLSYYNRLFEVELYNGSEYVYSKKIESLSVLK